MGRELKYQIRESIRDGGGFVRNVETIPEGLKLARELQPKTCGKYRVVRGDGEPLTMDDQLELLAAEYSKR